MHARSFQSGPRPQSGAVLLVAVLLLLLAGIMTVFAMNVGLFEQRSTGNDVRAKAVTEVAEAGLAQGFEYLMRQHSDMLDDAGAWERCLANDDTFPCGAISAEQIDTNGDGTADTARRATMFRLQATSHTITGLDNALAQHMLELPTTSKIADTANGATVAYGVAPVACFMQRPASGAANQPILCDALGSATTTEQRAVTFVSVAKIPGESASATVVQTIGHYPKLKDPMGKPPITASGSADVTGTLQIVTNPNAGGAGVPVSVWTRRDVAKTGTTNTCYADEFFRYTQGNATPIPYQGTIRCDDCRCDANGAPVTLSYDNSGNLQNEGIDILDVEGTSADRGTGTNYNVRSDSHSLATWGVCEFPPDMFNYVFGVRTWNDTDADCFGESRLSQVTYQNPESGATFQVWRDEAWLYVNADKIIATAANLAKVPAAKQAASLAAAVSAGANLVWCQQNCDATGELGSPSSPVVLVLDRPSGSWVTIHGIVFGLVFIREPGNNLNASTGGVGSGNCPSNCAMKMNANSAIYGALVLQGQMQANGTAAVIHDPTVLGGLEEALGTTPATLPGAWNDRVSY